MAKIDLTGRRFGRLTVLRENPEPYRKPSTGKSTRRWDCRCDCGNTCTVLQSALLRKGNPTMSCGCLRLLANQDAKVEAMTSRVFGRLTVLGPVLKQKSDTSGSKTLWRCRCECGTEIVTTAQSLLYGMKRSCGCLRSEASGERVHRDVGHYAGTTVSAIRPERGANRNSKSGIKGVFWDKQARKWIATIFFRGKSKKLGRFDTPEAAAAARKAAEEEMFGPVIEEYDNGTGGKDET